MNAVPHFAQSYAEARDKYGRLLAYVYVGTERYDDIPYPHLSHGRLAQLARAHGSHP